MISRSAKTEDVEHGPFINVETHGRVLVVTLNRPRVHNAVNLQMAIEIERAMRQLDESPELVVGVIAAEGKSFCSGMDLKSFARGERPVTERGFAGVVEQPPRKPLIAAVDGPAVGGGLELVLACDIVVASEQAAFGLPEVKRGLVAAGGGLLRLPRRIPPSLAALWALTGRIVPASEAARAGLIDSLVPAGQASIVARELADEIARNAPLAVEASMRILRESRDWSQGEWFQRQLTYSKPVRLSGDAREGALAFKEKREPSWTGQ